MCESHSTHTEKSKLIQGSIENILVVDHSGDGVVVLEIRNCSNVHSGENNNVSSFWKWYGVLDVCVSLMFRDTKLHATQVKSWSTYCVQGSYNILLYQHEYYNLLGAAWQCRQNSEVNNSVHW